MRLGINADLGHSGPEEWIEILCHYGVRAAVAPMKKDDPADVKRAYLKAARENDIVIAEVGIWRNVLDPDEKKSRGMIEYAKEQLAFADEIGARCCVNISGAVGEDWDGYYPENYLPETYERIVDITREIIDAVKPMRTYFTLEPMYWQHPDSPDDYLRLIRDIDRDRFAVHMDYVNMITSMKRYHNCDAFIAECFHKLGPYIKSVHAKDIVFHKKPAVCLTESMPGTGRVNFEQVFRLCEELDPDMPVLAEHLSSPREYEQAIFHMQNIWESMRESV